MRRRFVLFDRMVVITFMVMLMLGGAQALGEDENPSTSLGYTQFFLQI